MTKFVQGLILITLLFTVQIRHQAQGAIDRFTFSNGEQYLSLEILDDDLAHFELSQDAPDDSPIETSVMVANTTYDGASSLEIISDTEFITSEMRILVDTEALCATVSDISRTLELTLTTTCPLSDDEGQINGISFTPEGTTDVYGLGEQFRRRGGTDGNWFERRRSTTSTYGNTLQPFNGGNVGNAQFPVFYALGEGFDNYAVFVDHVYQQYWAFTGDVFEMRTINPPLRWYVMTGENLQDLRSDYMQLTGTPPVPPEQMFGLWVSEYGYESWEELETVLNAMLEANFTLDGFVLDLQWFGGITGNSQMGSLTWDTDNFPEPEAFIGRLRDEYGIGIMVIEESYVADSAENYAESLEAGVLVRECEDCPPAMMDSWWGNGGMVDWSNTDAAAWWHDNRRQHLIDSGVIGHWTDLGEPEDYVESAYYAGGDHTQAGIHNIYNLLWSQSIYEGYARNDVEQRPFILSRSGTSGSQRYGVAMWSGDIGANMLSLQEQMNVQMHMSMSGIDYFGADVGGFYRQTFDPVLGEESMYSVWLANAVLTDIPVRPHTINLQNTYVTAPALIGDVESNLANVRLRYELSPYLYTLAHRAYRTGEAVFPPLVYHFQDDLAVREIGGQKMLGDSMMMATLTDYTLESTDVYLPEGGWFNYHTNEFIDSTGETVSIISQIDEMLQPPLLVRDGAIIPTMPVDENTGTVSGVRRDGTVNNTIIFNIYHATQNGTFTLIEDDGTSIAYQNGAVRETVITHEATENGIRVTVNPANGTYANAPDSRTVEIRLIAPDFDVQALSLNGTVLEDWVLADGAIVISLPDVSVSDRLELLFEN